MVSIKSFKLPGSHRHLDNIVTVKPFNDIGHLRFFSTTHFDSCFILLISLLSNLHPFIYVRVQSPSFSLVNGQMQQGGRVSGLFSTFLGIKGTSLYSRGLEGGVLILLDISRVPSVVPPLQDYSPPFWKFLFQRILKFTM
ncbi:hypothetical protein AVEN_254543-1 [Araneus ventricosus]|uniref:Uncharacterized protein n=1 Tax=Araneus ventricosus TaxID=182803 RepID=A0A4Y2M8N7_ARAVE|nr:hypothetical protein AVEN_254543-1 [Araneus ventricosus]